MGENPCVSRQKMRHFQEKALHYCKKTFNIETDVSNSRIDRFRKGNLYCISIIDQFLVKEILDSAKLEFSGVSGGMPLVSNSIVYQRDCCKRAFVRGAFLSAGSISDPQKGYHFEIVCPSQEISGAAAGNYSQLSYRCQDGSA